MPDFSRRKLGKKRAQRDARTLCFETYWNGMKAAAMPAHPANENKMTVVHGYAADGNTRYGDCVECALVHMVETFRALAGHPITFTEAQTLALYSAITGFDPAKPETDQGTALLDALKFWKNCGVTGPDGVAHTIGAFVAIDITNLDAVEAALHLFDGIFLGVGLPKTAQTQRLWDVVGDGKTGDSAPYSWGGHCVPYLEYQPDRAEFPSWGEILGATWRFTNAYVDEAFVVITQDQLNDTGLSDCGFDLAALQRDLAIVSGQPDPGPPPFVPDPQLAALNTWLSVDIPYLTGRYLAGDVAAYRGGFATLRQTVDGWTPYVQGSSLQAPALPALPPSPAAERRAA